MKSKAETCRMEGPANGELGQRIAACDARHHSASRGTIDYISHLRQEVCYKARYLACERGWNSISDLLILRRTRPAKEIVVWKSL